MPLIRVYIPNMELQRLEAFDLVRLEHNFQTNLTTNSPFDWAPSHVKVLPIPYLRETIVVEATCARSFHNQPSGALKDSLNHVAQVIALTLHEALPHRKVKVYAGIVDDESQGTCTILQD